jgi:hypothetical protein
LLKIVISKEAGSVQWLKSPSQLNGNNLTNVRHETSRTFRNIYEKPELMSLKQTVRKNEICRGTNAFKKGYQPRTKLVKKEKGNLLAGSHNILHRWKNYL